MADNKEKKGDLEKLKKEYETLKKKYGLPEFSKLVEDFYVERAAETETDYSIREIRRFMADKFFNYLRAVEALLNPSNVPMYVFSMVKSLSSDDKKKLSEIYTGLAKIEIEIMELDLHYSEEEEANFIKTSYAKWQKIKKDFSGIINLVKKNFDVKSEAERRDYFG